MTQWGFYMPCDFKSDSSALLIFSLCLQVTVKHRIQHQRYDILICKIVKVCTDLLTINKTERLTFEDRGFPSGLCLFFNCCDALPWVSETSDVRFRSGFGQVFISDQREKGSFFLAALAKSFGRPKHPAAREKNTSGTQQVVVFLYSVWKYVFIHTRKFNSLSYGQLTPGLSPAESKMVGSKETSAGPAMRFLLRMHWRFLNRQ